MRNERLLLIGFSNWNYYLTEDGTGVMARAKKDSGSSDSYFGNLDYFRNWLLKNLKENDKYEARLTAAGFGTVPEWEIR